MAFAADRIDNIIYVSFADFLAFRFHHDPDHRLSTGLPHQDPAGIPQLGCDFRNRCLDI